MDEKEILNFWKEKKIYKKSKEKNSSGKGFYMMDGPPYATGHIHMGTALNKILKDIIARQRRLEGYDVFDRAGYDTHGVPIEFQVEKEIGSKGKQDVEKYGVKKFIEKCKNFATQYIDVMNEEFIDLGVWLDFEKPYLTLDDDYMESIWHVFKEADKKDLLYLGKYPVHVCTRCATAVSYNEIEYGKQKDKSVYVKFPIKKQEGKFLIIWTTTPWTLPANAGIMVHPKFDYVEVKVGKETWIIAEELTEKVMSKVGKDYKVLKKIKGEDLENIEYENPLSKNTNVKISNGNKVLLAGRYVTLEDGTGLVHCAPGHGKEDYEVGKEYGIDMPCPVGIDGIMKEEAGKYSGMPARQANKQIIEDLEEYIVAAEEYEHDYPLCWRDKTPLLMISQPQWFLRISKIHKELLKKNDKINWIPDYMKLRMKAWLGGIGDWPISRQRYWGTPLPIWYDDETGEKVVVGSIAELEKLSGKKVSMHKPEIDEITIKYKGKTLKRIPEVLDVWFDSGATSWGALGYPRDKEKFKKFWPADINIEGKDQFRGWWNSQMILSEIAFGKSPMENIAVHGLVLDISKRKMSKSLGNATKPEEVIKKYSRDYLRYYLAKSSKGEDFAFDERDFKDIQNVFRVFVNINNYVNQIEKVKSSQSVEDKWIMSRFNNCIISTSELFNQYKVNEAIRVLEKFLVEDLSKSYIQMTRERSAETYSVLEEIRNKLLVLFAPITPFLTEKIWQEMRKSGAVKEESVHLANWPKADKKKIDLELEKDFDVAMGIIREGLSERDKAGIGLKWPLSLAKISSPKTKNKLDEIIMGQLNVKSLKFKETKEISVVLDTEMTPELEGEGFAREIARRVQAERKNKGLNKKDRIELHIYVNENLMDMLSKQKELLESRTGSKKIFFTDDKNGMIIFKVKEEEIGVRF